MFSIQSSAVITVNHTHINIYPKTWKQIWRVTDIFIYMCLIDTKTSSLTPPVKHSPLLSVSHHFNKIRWVYYRFVKLHDTTLQHINWLELQFFSLPYISILVLFLHTMTPYYSTASLPSGSYWTWNTEYRIG